MEIDVRKTLQDTAYIAVGVGVIGMQNAGARARAAQAKITDLADDVRDRIAIDRPVANPRALVGQAKEAGAKAQAQAKGATTRLTAQAKGLIGRAEPVVGDFRHRVGPLTEQFQTLPEQVGKVIDTGRQRVRQLVPTAS